MDFRFKILIFIIFAINFRVTKTNLSKIRNRRTLIFPPTAPTRIQFIGGIGIPVEDLFHESVTSGYVFKAEYFLPSRADELTPNYLRPQPIQRRSASLTLMTNDTTTTTNETTQNWIWKQQNTIAENSHLGSNWKNQQTYASIYRWIFYKAIEVALSSSGLPGRECLLRSICEHAEASMHYGGGILAELLHIILTPSMSHDKFRNNSDKLYIQAEYTGRSGIDCKIKFSSCQKSPMDLITTVFDFDNLY